MAENHPLQSTTSSQPATGQLISYLGQNLTLDRQKAEQLSTLLRRLAIPYYCPDFTKELAEVKIADYILDLAEFAICDVEDAIRQYRRDAKSDYFPKPGALYKLAATARHERIKFADMKPVRRQFSDSRPLCWWTRPKADWKPNWLETEVPAGERVRDVVGGAFREPDRTFA